MVRSLRSLALSRTFVGAVALALVGSSLVASPVAAAGIPVNVTLVSGTNPVCRNRSVDFFITVRQPPGSKTIPTGTVTLTDNSTLVGTLTQNGFFQAVIAVSFSTVGSHVMVANYGGDTNFAPGVSNPVTETVRRCGHRRK